MARRAISSAFFFFLLSSLAMAGAPPQEKAGVPRLVKFSGHVGQVSRPVHVQVTEGETGTLRTGKPVAHTASVTFAVYSEQDGGAALWQETQNVALDADGRYNVLLGAASREGVPAELFATGEPRWLGVRVNVAGDAEASGEQARVLLVSVPYALRAADADTVGGRAASDFVLREELAGWSGIAAGAHTGAPLPGAADAPRAVGGTQGIAVDATGNINRVPRVLSATGSLITYTDGLFFDDGTNVGLGTTTPVALLDLQLTTAVPRDTLSAAVTLNNAAPIPGSVVTPFRMTLNDQSTNTNLSKQAMRVIYNRDTGATGGVTVFDSAVTLASFFRSSAPYAYRILNVEGPRIFNGQTLDTMFGIFIEAPPANVGGNPAGTITNKFALVTQPGSGNVGIGTTAPAFPLSVSGTIESLAGGFRFPDGTTQTTAAVDTNSGGTVTSVATSTGLMGGTITTAGTLSLDTGFTDSRYLLKTGGALTGGLTGTTAGFSGTTTTTNSAVLRATQNGSSLTTAQFINPPPAAVRGETTTGTGFTVGVLGISNSADGIGLAGLVNGASSIGAYVENASGGAVFNWGVLSLAAAEGATAVQGEATSNAGDAWGVNGISHSTLGIGVRGDATATSGPTIGLYGFVKSTQGVGLYVDNEVGGNLVIGAVNGVNKFRVDGTGKGFFNGTTQNFGADFAESVEVAGERAEYGPGDVLLIDPAGRRRFMLSRRPYATGVAGIYSTKPGVLATAHEMDDPRLVEEIPMAMVGIVPCKVSAENGPIAAGDLLVTSSVAGHAMRGTKRGRMLGAIVGKALEPFDPRDAQGRPLRKATGVIQVLVTLQ